MAELVGESLFAWRAGQFRSGWHGNMCLCLKSRYACCRKTGSVRESLHQTKEHNLCATVELHAKSRASMCICIAVVSHSQNHCNSLSSTHPHTHTQLAAHVSHYIEARLVSIHSHPRLIMFHLFPYMTESHAQCFMFSCHVGNSRQPAASLACFKAVVWSLASWDRKSF